MPQIHERKIRIPPDCSQKLAICDNQRIVATEILPAYLVDGVSINPFAEDLLPRAYHYLLDPKKLIDLARLTIPFNAKVLPDLDPRKILTPSLFGRALPLAYGYIPINGQFIHTFLFGKGCSLSGIHYPIPGKSKYYPPTQYRNEPTGFFGHRDSKKETDISNLLLANNIRSSLVWANIALNPTKLRVHLYNKNRSISDNFAKRLIDKLDIVLTNGDVPTYLIRSSGLPMRINSSNYNQIAKRYTSAMLAKAAAIWLQETSINNNNHPLSTLSGETLTILTKLTSRQNLKLSDYTGFIQIIATILSDQIAKAHKLIQDESLSQPGNLSYLLFDSKDTDLALFATDFEEANQNSSATTQISDLKLDATILTTELILLLQKAEIIPFKTKLRMLRTNIADTISTALEARNL